MGQELHHEAMVNDWTVLLRPFRFLANRLVVTYVRDPSIGFAVLLTVAGLILILVDAASPRRSYDWVVGKLAGIATTFTVLGLACCFVPADRGLLLTRVEATVAAVLVALCWVALLLAQPSREA